MYIYDTDTAVTWGLLLHCVHHDNNTNKTKGRSVVNHYSACLCLCLYPLLRLLALSPSSQGSRGIMKNFLQHNHILMLDHRFSFLILATIQVVGRSQSEQVNHRLLNYSRRKGPIFLYLKSKVHFFCICCDRLRSFKM